LEIVVSAHEIIHRAIKKNEKGVILKLNYENAYDRVSWHFVEEMLVTRGFGSRWIAWVLSLIKGGSISIRMNDENNAYFKSRKWLRQGDPLSPLLFDLVVEPCGGYQSAVYRWYPALLVT
jgi:hypothetical protein